MNKASVGGRSSAFSWWLRTGTLPPALSPDGLELKFNPWHDPADGRFTFAGAGSHYGASGADAAGGTGNRTSVSSDHTSVAKERGKSQTSTSLTARTSRTSRAEPVAEYGQSSAKRASPKAKPNYVEGSRLGYTPNTVTEFFGGVGDGLYDVAKGTSAGVHAALTTNPMTTVRSVGRSIAGMIDATIAAEDTPAHIQVSRAASAVANASARVIGRATGTVAGNVALAAAPGAAFSKAAALRRLRMMKPRTTFDPPQIGWVRENVRSQKPWKAYNDAATGA